MSREIFAKMSGTLDSNRKIRKAGRNGREVFLWVLRQVALRDSDGGIPTEDLTDFEYLADQLMCSPDDAADGVAAATREGLLCVTDGVTQIVGWDDGWSRRPRSNAERQAEWRLRHGNAKKNTDSSTHSVTETPLRVTDGVTSNVVEESRVEESRERGAVTPDASHPASPAGFRLETPQPKPVTRRRDPSGPRQVGKHALPDDWTPDASLEAEARAAGVDLTREIAKLRDWAKAENAKKADWHATARNWLRRAGEKPMGHRPPATQPPRRKFL